MSSSKTPPREGEKKRKLQAPIKMTPSPWSTPSHLLLLTHMHGHAVQQLAAAPSIFMAQEAPEIPVVYSSSSTSQTSGILESHQIIQMHAPFPSWSPYDGTLLAAADPAAFCADSLSSSLHTRLPSRHLWNQTDLSMEHGGSNGYGKDFLSLLETRNVTPEMLEYFPTAPCDYLKGMDSDYISMAGSAPYGLDSVGRYAGSSALPIRHDEIVSSPLVHPGNSTVVQGNMGRMPCNDHEVKRDGNHQQELGAPMNAFLQQMLPSIVAIQGSSLGYCGIGNERACPEGRVTNAYFDSRSSPDAISFSGYRSNTELTCTNQHEQHIMSARTSRSGGAVSAPKKRKSEEKLGGNAKKSKQDILNTPPSKAQAPCVKLGEKVIALQQIVSPFGKTDRASVLFETIKHIEYLHEQIQLFSEPHMKTSTNKRHIQWGGEEEKQEAGLEHDLRGRGLCLVPVSWTPQVYRDNSLPDCWTPACKSSLHR